MEANGGGSNREKRKNGVCQILIKKMLFYILCTFFLTTSAIDDGQARTPPMGWNSVRLLVPYHIKCTPATQLPAPPHHLIFSLLFLTLPSVDGDWVVYN